MTPLLMKTTFKPNWRNPSPSFSVYLALATRYPSLLVKLYPDPLCKHFLSAAGLKEAMYKKSGSHHHNGQLNTGDNSENITPFAPNRKNFLPSAVGARREFDPLPLLS